MLNPWRAELPFLFLGLLVGGFFAKLLHQPAWVLWVCLLVYLARHLFYANRLLEWLRSGRAGQPPEGTGIWEEIYYLIFRLRRRNKRRKKQLIRMLERFRTATAALPDATVVLGPRDEIDWFNDAAARLLGLRRSDIGQKVGNLIRYPKFNHYLTHADYNLTVGIPSPALDGVQLEIRVVPYGEHLRLLLAQDVTQLRFMERVRTDFIANVSHELRTPLTVLRGYLEALAQGGHASSEAQGKIFLRMEEQTLRMQSLIDGSLSLSRLESGGLPLTAKPVDFDALLRSVSDESRLLAKDEQQIELLLESHAGVHGSEAELRSAASNLVVNALKYSPAGAKVVIRWCDDRGGARLDVSDNGPGIASEHLSRLTERFYRVDVDGIKCGSGLGLAIVKHVLARHSAELKITSGEGKGSCFSCWFPPSRIWRKETAFSPPAGQALAEGKSIRA